MGAKISHFARVALLWALLPACGDSSAESTADGGSDGDASERPRRVMPGEPGAEAGGGSSAEPGDAGAIGDAASGLTPLPCDIAGILRDNCIRCHSDPPLLDAPFPLLSWEDLDMPWGELKVREVALQRVTATTGRMPPRPATPLGTAQIDALRRWIDDGAPPGDNPACLLGGRD